MFFSTVLLRDLSDTKQVKTFPVFHSVWGMWSWLVTATRPSALMLMSFVDGDACWDSGNHLIWGLKPHPEHKILCGPDSLLGTWRSSTDGSTKHYVSKWINQWIDRSHYQFIVQRTERETPLTKNIASGVWLEAAGETLIHFAGETCVSLPVVWRDSEASTDWMEAWGFRKINILFVRDVNTVGLKGDVEVTGGELCDVTLQHSTVSLQQIWERSPDLHWWSCNCRRWMIQKENKEELF